MNQKLQEMFDQNNIVICDEVQQKTKQFAFDQNRCHFLHPREPLQNADDLDNHFKILLKSQAVCVQN